MILSRKALSRRTVLRGAGAAIALPLLDAMSPALSSAAPTSSPLMGFFYVPNGMFLPNFHPEGSGGTSFKYTPILKPLEPLHKHITVVSGLSNRGLLSSKDGGGVHTRAHGGWLSGVLPRRTEGSDLTAGKTIDQYAADKLGADTPLRSLELTTESNFQVGNCESGYSCSYLNSTSWRTASQPLPHERDPRAIFERLFGDGGGIEARMRQMQQDRSILDSVSASMRRLEKRIGVSDRGMVSDYLDAVRAIETRIQRTEANNKVSPLPTMEEPMGVPESYDDHVKILSDLLLLAWQGDITRVSCFQLARELSPRPYPWAGVPEAHHAVSHHQNDPHNIEQNTKINTYHVSLYARFVEKLAQTPDGPGTLLDRAIVVYGAGMGDGDQHSPIDLPVIVAGGGQETMKNGRHLRVELNTPFMNAGLTLLEKVGVHVEQIADSTGIIKEL
jgi:hypothetical protein